MACSIERAVPAFLASMTLALAATVEESAAQQAPRGGAVIRSDDGRSSVYIGGQGVGVVGSTDASGFEGIVVGPDGQVRRLRPAPSGEVRTPVRAGAVAGPSGFDPFLFAFGQSRSPFAPAAVPIAPPADLAAAASAFRRGDHTEALRRIDRLGQFHGDDPNLGQARALALFALGDHRAAGDEALAALSTGAGRWGWEVIRRFYGDPNSYLDHYRDLLRAARARPESVEVQFLLGYHAMVVGRYGEARQALVLASEARPGDPAIAVLLEAIPPEVMAPSEGPDRPSHRP